MTNSSYDKWMKVLAWNGMLLFSKVVSNGVREGEIVLVCKMQQTSQQVLNIPCFQHKLVKNIAQLKCILTCHSLECWNISLLVEQHWLLVAHFKKVCDAKLAFFPGFVKQAFIECTCFFLWDTLKYSINFVTQATSSACFEAWISCEYHNLL